MKRTLSVGLLTLLLIVGLFGCGEGDKSSEAELTREKELSNTEKEIQLEEKRIELAEREVELKEREKELEEKEAKEEAVEAEEEEEVSKEVVEEKRKPNNKKVETENINTKSQPEKKNALAEYSSKEIEYARVWLQVIGNLDTEELNVVHIPAGELVNPYDDESVDYPEEVISLGGHIMAAGGVTYSGNGDGTINLYNTPSHWPSYMEIDESMEDYTRDIIENTELIYIDKGNDKDVIKLIEMLSISR